MHEWVASEPAKIHPRRANILDVNAPCARNACIWNTIGTIFYVKSVAVKWVQKWEGITWSVIKRVVMRLFWLLCNCGWCTSLSFTYIKQRDICDLRRPMGTSSGQDEETTSKIWTSEGWQAGRDEPWATCELSLVPTFPCLLPSVPSPWVSEDGYLWEQRKVNMWHDFETRWSIIYFLIDYL